MNIAFHSAPMIPLVGRPDHLVPCQTCGGTQWLTEFGPRATATDPDIIEVPCHRCLDGYVDIDEVAA